MKKLIAIMIGGNALSSQIGQRAVQTARRIELEQNSLINNLERSLEEKRAQYAEMTDIGPDETTSTRPTARSFDPKDFVAKVQSLQVEMLQIEVELTIAKKTLAEWSADPETAAADSSTASA